MCAFMNASARADQQKRGRDRHKEHVFTEAWTNEILLAEICSELRGIESGVLTEGADAKCQCNLIYIHVCMCEYMRALLWMETVHKCVSWITNSPLTSKASFSCNACICQSPVGTHNDILSPERPPLFWLLFPWPCDWLLCTLTNIQLLAALRGSGEMRYKCQSIYNITAQKPSL